MLCTNVNKTHCRADMRSSTALSQAGTHTCVCLGGMAFDYVLSTYGLLCCLRALQPQVQIWDLKQEDNNTLDPKLVLVDSIEGEVRCAAT